MPLDGIVHVGERQLVQHFGQCLQMILDPVEGIVDFIPQPHVRCRSIVEIVLLQELFGQFEIFPRHSVVHELLELAYGCAEGEVRVGILNGPDPDFEDLLPACGVGCRELTRPPIRETLDVRIIAVIHASGFPDDLVQMAARVPVLSEP